MAGGELNAAWRQNESVLDSIPLVRMPFKLPRPTKLLHGGASAQPPSVAESYGRLVLDRDFERDVRTQLDEALVAEQQGIKAMYANFS